MLVSNCFNKILFVKMFVFLERINKCLLVINTLCFPYASAYTGILLLKNASMGRNLRSFCVFFAVLYKRFLVNINGFLCQWCVSAAYQSAAAATELKLTSTNHQSQRCSHLPIFLMITCMAKIVGNIVA